MDKKKQSRIEIGNRIVIIRESLGMSQQKFAEHVDLSVNFLSQVENGNRGLSADSVGKISEKTGYSADYIVLGKTGDTVISPDSRDRIRGYLFEALKTLDEDS